MYRPGQIIPTDCDGGVVYRVMVYEDTPPSSPIAKSKPATLSLGQKSSKSAVVLTTTRLTPSTRVPSVAGVHRRAQSLSCIKEPLLVHCSTDGRVLPSKFRITKGPIQGITRMKKERGESTTSRRPSIFSIASSYFGPIALGSDISLDRQISPELQTSHVYFNEGTFEKTPSPYSLSVQAVQEDVAPASPTTQDPGVPVVSPPNPSPPAPSLAPSVQLTPAASAETGNVSSAEVSNTTDQSRHSSRFGSIASLFPERKSSISSFFKKTREKASRLFSKSSSSDDQPLRSTFVAPKEKNKKHKPTKAEKSALKRQKSADKYIQRKTKQRLRAHKREMKKKMSKTTEAKLARLSMTKTEKLLKVMDDAKEKFWDWLDKREEKKRRKQTKAYTAMREERRKSVLVPVERDYEVVERRQSRYESVVV